MVSLCGIIYRLAVHMKKIQFNMMSNVGVEHPNIGHEKAKKSPQQEARHGFLIQ